jgi:uncharacterized Ntn-hydrolase superfamily protein
MTYSIVARDRDTGELGVAVQSHYFSVGSVVPWARPGVGAVATQAMAEITYGPKGIELMSSGVSAPDALASLLAEDAAAASRQVAMVDVQGRAAAHTGASTIPSAGHIVGDQVSCQGNIMASEKVWPAMLAAYEASSGPLHGRLLAALDAAEAEGGDVRGRQSVAILVVPASGEPWEKVLELRVEDHPEPLAELRRLIDIHQAYALTDQGDELITAGDHDAASTAFREALALSPGNHELRFWAGLSEVHGGDLDGGLALVRAAIALQPGWAALLPKLSPEVMPSAPVVAAALGLSVSTDP